MNAFTKEKAVVKLPKIIEQLKSRLVEEARIQAAQGGYSAVTVRSVAAACGVGVGTVYNYFSSKDELLAAFLLADWKDCMSRICWAGEDAADAEPVLCCIYEELRGYLEKHRMVFRDEAARKVFGGVIGKYHGLLRTQLAQPLRRFCPDDFTAEFLAESLLTWTVEGRDPAQLIAVIKKVL